MDDKILEVFKRYSKSVDTEFNVYDCLIQEDWIRIANEICLITEDKINEIILKERAEFTNDLRRIRESIK